jgi:excisionase family DNA binding protein
MTYETGNTYMRKKRRTTRLSIEECSQIIRQFVEGDTITNLAKRFKVSDQTIKNVINQETFNSQFLSFSNDTELIEKRCREIRRSPKLGSRNINAKLSEKDVLKIKRLLAEKKHTHQQIADKFDVTAKTISMISNGQSWDWLNATKTKPPKPTVTIEKIDFTVEEAADQLGLAKDSIYAWIRRGWLKGKKFGRNWRFSSKQIDSALKKYGPSQGPGYPSHRRKK